MARLRFVQAALNTVDFHLYELNVELNKLSSTKRTERNLIKINKRGPIVYDLIQRMYELLIINLYNFFEIKEDLNSLVKSNKTLMWITKSLDPFWEQYLEPVQGVVNDMRENVLAHGSIDGKKGYKGLNDIVVSQYKLYKKIILASKVAQMYADAIISHRGSGGWFANMNNIKKHVPSENKITTEYDYFKMHRVAHRIQKDMETKLKSLPVVYTGVKFAKLHEFPRRFK